MRVRPRHQWRRRRLHLSLSSFPFYLIAVELLMVLRLLHLHLLLLLLMIHLLLDVVRRGERQRRASASRRRRRSCHWKKKRGKSVASKHELLQLHFLSREAALQEGLPGAAASFFSSSKPLQFTCAASAFSPLAGPLSLLSSLLSRPLGAAHPQQRARGVEKERGLL